MNVEDLKSLHPAYKWIVEQGLIGWQPFSALQPWYLLPTKEMFDASQRWPSGPIHDQLQVFAKRQDCDLVACIRKYDNAGYGVTVIEGWIGNSFDVVAEMKSIWDWLKFAIDDVQEWSEQA